MKNKKIKFRVFLWLILAFISFWFLFIGIVPNGRIVYKFDFSKKSDFISKLSPIERMKLNDRSFENSVIGDPVYLTLRTPRRFNKAKVSLKYKNETNYPIIESGLLVDGTLWRYNLKPVENKIMDELVRKWEVIEEGDLMLLQNPVLNSTTTISSTTKKFSSIQEFIDNPPTFNQIALYNYNLKSDFIISDYASSSEEREINYNLRGSYQFFTYIKDEELSFNFNFLDINLNRDEDPVDIILYYNDRMIDSRHLDDDGSSNDDGEETEERSLDFKLVGLPEGVYKLEVRANDDMVTKSIKTKQSKIAFQNNIWLFEGDSNLELWTDSKFLQVKTVNPGSLQVIEIGEQDLEIAETYKQFEIELNATTTTKNIQIKKEDIILAGDGVFSFKESEILSPKFKKVDSNFIENDEVYYIITSYVQPTLSEGWRISTLEHDLRGAYTEDGKYKFIISIPGLKMDDEKDDEIIIDEIKVELIGDSLIDFVKRKIYGKN